MERLFREGDRIIKVEHFGIVSRMSNYNFNLEKWVDQKEPKKYRFCYESRPRGSFF
jgi:hypothetical protein